MKLTSVKLARMKKGITQKQAADALEITREYLSQIENNKASLTGGMLIKMAHLYNRKTVELIPSTA